MLECERVGANKELTFRCFTCFLHTSFIFRNKYFYPTAFTLIGFDLKKICVPGYFPSDPEK